jgi:PAS domain S-box-containing protein
VMDITERKQMERATERLREQSLIERMRLETIINVLPIGFAVVDEKGRNIQANKKFEQVWGRPRPPANSIQDYAAFKAKWTDTGEPVKPDQWASAQAVQEGKTVTNQLFEIERFDGKSAFVLNSAAPFRDAEGKITGAAVAILDITELHAAQETLKQSEERYRSLFNTMTEGFALHEIICNAKGKPVDYRFLEVNPAFENLTGLKAKDILGKTVKEVIPATEDFWINTYGEVALTGKSTNFEDYSKPLGRHYEVFAYRPAPMQFAVVFMDITERKRAEQALRQSEEKFRSIVKFAPAAIYEMDLAGNKFYSVNKAMCDILGYSSEELLSMNPAELLDSKSRSLFGERIKKKLAGENIDVAVDYRIRRKDGQWIDAAVNVGAFSYTGETPTRVVVIGYDITERKRMEDALRESEGRFRALTETSSLAVGVSSSDGKFLYLNKAYEKLFGYTLNELNHLNASELWRNPEDRSKMVDAVRSKGFLMDYEVELKRKNGTPFWAMLSANSVDYCGNQAIMATVYDITDRKQAEEAIRKSNEELSRFNKTAVGRELRMIELKKEVNYFCEQAGKPKRYPLEFEKENDNEKIRTPTA